MLASPIDPHVERPVRIFAVGHFDGSKASPTCPVHARQLLDWCAATRRLRCENLASRINRRTDTDGATPASDTAQSVFRLSALTIGCHLAVSDLSKSAKSSGVTPSGTELSFRSVA